jgi:ribonuclease HI
MNRGIQQLQAFGDSLLVIKWMNNQLDVQNITLLSLAAQLKENSKQFVKISFAHVYRELNTIADALSKAGLALPVGQLRLEESIDGISTELRQPV